jgi:hypothetical protein
MDTPPPATGPQSPPNGDDPQLDAIRAILFDPERDRIQHLEAENAILREQAQQQQAEIDQLQAELNKLAAESEHLVPRLKPVMADLMGHTIRDSRDDMAEALAPVIGESIRVQIRDSRQDMIDALYPIIGETVQRAVREAIQEFQRNIDAQLKRTFGPEGVLRTTAARLRGVSPAELALRDSLPFNIRELFLIQHNSGLLLAHSHHSLAEVTDSDLISAMLTAIRDFAHDSFGHGAPEKELDEVQYGDQRIIIQSGRTAYLAAVIVGVEPEGFRAKLRQFVSELHVRYEKELKEYNGDPATVPNLQPKLARLVVDATGSASARPRTVSRNTWLALASGGLLGVILLGLACFYLQFTIALYPLAFPGNTATPTTSATPTVTATVTQSATPTVAPSQTPAPSSTFTATPTSTPTPRPSATFTPTPSVVTGIAIGNVWSRGAPSLESPVANVLPIETAVTVRAAFGPWIEVEWTTAAGTQRGWVPARWIALDTSIPPGLITPGP